MDATRWTRIGELFEAALELEPAPRGAYLDVQCTDDRQLRAEIESLLASTAAADAYFAGLSQRAAPFPPPTAAPDLTGTRIDHYRILALLGRGGMGAVYLAERADAQFEKKVALKLLPLGMAGEEAQRRFRRERQVLAQLEHPHIARLLDGGMTVDGTPYFVMEYVEGTPVDDFCDERDLGIPERLELFLQICEAVEYAHRNLIVHRDLKAPNVLVTDAGEVKLLDFGIAGILEEGVDAASVTGWGGRLLTPAFASPEQVRNERVGTATDVYSLGVLLYRLVTGHPPYQVAATDSPARIEAVICEHVPELPSRMVRRGGAEAAPPTDRPEPPQERADRNRVSHRVARQLRGDLDAIMLTALRKEPAERYATVREFAEDIRRHLRSEPVRARRGNGWYRAQRFLSRRRFEAAAASLLLILLLSVAVLLARETVRTREYARVLATERDHARREAVRAERISGLLVGLFEDSDPAGQGQTPSATVLLNRGAERARSELGEEPAIQASLLHVIGEAYFNLGLYRDAEPVLEEAIRIRRALGHPADSELAESLYRLAASLARGQHYPQAEPHFREALSVLTRLSASAAGDTALSRRRATATGGLAAVLVGQGQADSAVSLLRGVVDTLTLLKGPGHPTTLNSLNALAKALRTGGNTEEAESLYRDVIRRQRSLGQDARLELATTLNNLGYLLRTREAFTEAEALYREAWEINRAELGEAHPTTIMLMANNLTPVLARQGKLDEAEHLLRRAIELETESSSANGWRTGAAWGALGAFLLQARHDPAAAELPLTKQLEIFEASLGGENSWTARARLGLGGCLLELGRLGQAEPLLRAAYPAIRDKEGAASPRTRQALQALLSLSERRGDTAAAQHYRTLLGAAE